MNKELKLIEVVLKRKYPFIIGIEPDDNLNRNVEVTYFINIIIKTDKLGSVINEYSNVLGHLRHGIYVAYYNLYIVADDMNNDDSEDVKILRDIQKDIYNIIETVHEGSFIPDEFKIDRRYLEVNKFEFK